MTPLFLHTTNETPHINQIIDEFTNLCTILDHAEPPDPEVEMEGTNDDEFASNQINTIFVCDGPDDDHNQIINSIADEMIDNYIPISDLPFTSPFYNPDHPQSIFVNPNITTPASPSIDPNFIAPIATPQDACIFDGSFNHTMLIDSGSQVTMIPTHHPLHNYTILQLSAHRTSYLRHNTARPLSVWVPYIYPARHLPPNIFIPNIHPACQFTPFHPVNMLQITNIALVIL